jgi:hypothetical protein
MFSDLIFMKLSQFNDSDRRFYILILVDPG